MNTRKMKKTKRMMKTRRGGGLWNYFFPEDKRERREDFGPYPLMPDHPDFERSITQSQQLQRGRYWTT